MEVITEEAVSARIYPGLEETPEFRGMLFILQCCLVRMTSFRCYFLTKVETDLNVFGLLCNFRMH